MATLEKIRSKGVLLLIIVGIALLAFIVGDFLNSGATYFNRSRENVAEIMGESVHINDYSAAIDQMTEMYKIELGRTDINEDMMVQIRNSVWETMLNRQIISTETKKIGLAVTSDELSERCIGSNVHPIIAQRRYFADQSGRFSHAQLMQFLNVLQMEPENNEMAEQIKQAKNYWMFWEKAVYDNMLQEKYVTLLSKCVTANSLDAKMNFETRKNTVDVSYVMQPYYSVPDSVVEVSNSEIKALYNKRKAQYKQEPNRNINYIAFNIVPSEADFADVEAWINKLKPEFETTEDVAAVVNSNSDVIYDGRNYSETTVPANLKEFAFAGKKNDVTPVLFENDTYTIARIMETGLMVADSVQLRHIYLAGNNQERVDSIVNAIKKGADFGALARQYSLVEQTAAKGGEIGWLKEADLEKEMAAQAFDKAKNEVFTMPAGQGVQIFQIMDKSAATPKVKLAILERKVTPSSKTYSILYNAAKQFVVENNTAEKFDAAAKEQNLSISVGYGLQKNTEKVNDLVQSRAIVRWAFEASQGAISDVFECSNSFVVAALTDVKDGEYRSLQDVSGELKAELIKNKKAELMIADLKAALEQNNTLEAAAAAAKADIQVAEAINFASYRFGAAGMEPYIIGLAAAQPTEQISAPVQGNNGVFVIKTTNEQISEATYDETSEIMQLNMRYNYSLPYMALEYVRNQADIVDNRATFY